MTYKYSFLLEPATDGTLFCTCCWDLPCPTPEVPPNPQEPEPPAKRSRTERFQGKVVSWDKTTGLGEVEIPGMVERISLAWKDCDRWGEQQHTFLLIA